MRISIIIMGSLLLVFSTSLATIIHVPGQYPTIQDGIDAAVNGDTVLVANGTYAEHLNYNGKLIVVTSEEGPGLTFIVPASQRAPLVTFGSGETEESIISGFTLQHCFGSPAVDIVASSPWIENNVFSFNISNALGGAISAKSNSFPTIKNNVFVGNSGFRGGGIDSGEYTAGNIKIEGNLFIGNSCDTHGGAVFVRLATAASIHHNIFYMNSVRAMGAAICFSECANMEFYNNTVAYNINYESWNGTGVVVWYSNYFSVYNNIVMGNVGIGIKQEPYYTSTYDYNDVWLNTENYNGISPGGGSISDNPCFVSGYPYSFELMPNSPCIDAGDPNSPLDPDGTIADIGALYYPQVSSVDDQPRIPESWLLYQNYPNPFNAQTNISFSIPDRSDVKVEIFDTLGRKVRSLLDGQLQAGEYTVNWNGKSDTGERLSSGIYFYNLKTDRYEDSRKMVILK